MSEGKPMTVEDWEREVESLTKNILQLSLECNMWDKFESGKMTGFQYARYYLEKLLEFSRRGEGKGNE